MAVPAVPLFTGEPIDLDYATFACHLERRTCRCWLDFGRRGAAKKMMAPQFQQIRQLRQDQTGKGGRGCHASSVSAANIPNARPVPGRT